MRACVGVLLAQGHAHAAHYPLAYMFNEVRFTQNRIHAMIKTEAVVLNAAIVQAIAGGEHLKNVLEKLDGD